MEATRASPSQVMVASASHRVVPAITKEEPSIPEDQIISSRDISVSITRVVSVTVEQEKIKVFTARTCNSRDQ